PLDVHVLADLVLPQITVDLVEDWEAPGLEVEMVAEGAWLESPSDMAKVWPDAWANEQAARNWLRTSFVLFPLIDLYQGKLHKARYQHPGVGQPWRTAWFDPAVIPDARAWLEDRLQTQLAAFELLTICFVFKAESFSTGLDWGTPPLLTG